MITIKNCKIQQVNVGIHSVSIYRTILDRNFIYYSASDGIYLEDFTGKVENNFILLAGASGLHIASGSASQIAFNNFTNTLGTYAIRTGYFYNSSFIGNYIYNGANINYGFYCERAIGDIFTDNYIAGVNTGIYFDAASTVNYYGLNYNLASVTKIDDNGSTTRIFGDDTAYGVSWNADLGTPTKNAVYDKIEAVVSTILLTADVENIITAELVDGQSIDNAIDALIATHTAITNAHHTKYTDAEVEAIITAELVNGQSIDNAIDSLIATHAAISDVHHTKYTDAEVEAIITAELVNGQSIDNAIDTLIATHTAITNAHHTKYTDAEARTACLENDAYGVGWNGDSSHAPTQDAVYDIIAAIEAELAIGSANAQWKPCSRAESSDNSVIDNTGGSFSNTGATDFTIDFTTTLPPTKGSLSLYIKGIRIAIADADGGDYLDRVRLYGRDDNSVNLEEDDTTNRTAAGKYDYAFTAVDCSGYHDMLVRLNIVATNTHDFKGQTVAVNYYYA